MRYNKIRKMDISNGPGVRISIFLQGCTFHCKNFTDATIKRVLELCEKDYIEGLSILGGEPMHPKNREGTFRLAKAFKEKFPEKTLWVWTGFLLDRDLMDLEGLKYIDVLVDGQFVDELKDYHLSWRGSSNQRVIDVPKSLKAKKVVLLEGVAV